MAMTYDIKLVIEIITLFEYKNIAEWTFTCAPAHHLCWDAHDSFIRLCHGCVHINEY